MAKTYSKPTANQVEAANEKAARATRKADTMLKQFLGTKDFKPSAKQAAAREAAGKRLKAMKKAK